MKCCIVGCRAEGEPEKGDDFYACSKCLKELERLCRLEWIKRMSMN